MIAAPKGYDSKEKHLGAVIFGKAHSIFQDVCIDIAEKDEEYLRDEEE